ncbi:alpha-1 2-mannosidase [Persicobacter psychrovividus]|uniref:Alpha-1 2-mannosidase n=2 Tax=Persicobacter psychrovividus TaxID=387638 RepID=A0ABM7VEQ0_9BACT|nr:alpha-1 2-mannosidase [Persicobacter psychrovividus]
MVRNFYLLFFILLCGSAQAENQYDSQSDIIRSVNPFIGTSNEGNNYPGAVVPWGMVMPTPHTENFREKAPNAPVYEHHDPYIYGFGTVNISGVGCPVAGSVPLKVAAGALDLSIENFQSTYSEQVAHPGYYSVYLEKHSIEAEMTATQRSARYRFAAKGQEQKFQLLLDLGANVSHKKGGAIQLNADGSVTGYQNDGQFCGAKSSTKIYYYFNVLTPGAVVQLYQDEQIVEGIQQIEGKRLGVAFTFETDNIDQVEVEVGVSFVSAENARENLKVEQGNKSFDEIVTAAQQSWQEVLGRVEIEGDKGEEKTIFYTALYHTLLLPHVISDVNGDYPKMADTETALNTQSKYTRYSTFSLWDTYRTLHPLMALFYPQQQRDMVVTMLEMYKESGWLPKWELFGNDTRVMVGDPAIPVIVDSYFKGIKDFDIEVAKSAFLKHGLQTENNLNRPGNDYYWQLGYCPEDDRHGDPKKFSFENGIVWGTVSTTMEYNLADYGIGQFLIDQGDKKMGKKFLKQSQSLMKLYDPENSFFHAKNKDGSWHEPFNPLDRTFDIRWENSGGRGFCEGSAWQYNFFAPHATSLLVKKMGEELFVSKLNSVFADGHFDITNEPDISYPYLFNYVKDGAKITQEKIPQIADKNFFNGPKGIPGNDDAGTLSAWLVFSYLGIYPDAPGVPVYQLTTPRFNKVTLHFDDYLYEGKTLTLKKNTDSPYFDQAVNANGKVFKNFEISHEELINSSELDFIKLPNH